MRIFVASWFFPPVTSSEAIVTYKLLRNSKHEYDVCCSESELWSYKQALSVDASNIRMFPVKTDSIDEWAKQAVETFKRLHAEAPYDAFMTRSMPPESINVGREIHEACPDLPWFASIADPIAKSPYDIKGLVDDNAELSPYEKESFKVALRSGCAGWKSHKSAGVRHMCALKDLEDYAINNATALIFPHEALKNYVLGTRRRKNAFAVPHSFDKTLYPAVQEETSPADGKKTLSFLGHSDALRSLAPIVEALHVLQKSNPQLLEKLRLRFIGNVPEEVRALIYNCYLYDIVSLEPGVSYTESLSIMQSSDWLIHTDAHFPDLDQTGGSIFFAGKIADYFGTDAPVLAVTGEHSPAWDMVIRAGGICVEQADILGVADALSKIALDEAQVGINRAYRDTFDAVSVASCFDAQVEQVVNSSAKGFDRSYWPAVPAAEEGASKLLSICIPSYNVEAYLDRCLFSLVNIENPNLLDIMVVNDGSHDGTREIALAYQEKYPGIVRLIDKENGGHGSTINAATKEAKGLYFRVIDGDDWVDSANLSKLLKNIQSKELYADLVSTNYHQIYIEDGHLVPWVKQGAQANYEVFDFASNDFSNEYFTMASMMVKTELLRKANFQIQEHTFYVDVEFILYPIPYVETVMFTPEYVYRYAVGNADQSINTDAFMRRYDHHDRVTRRMVAYYADHKATMNVGQKAYMKKILTSRIFNTHYTLSLVWDTDRERGLGRACDFDEYLRKTDGELYQCAGELYVALRKVRGFHYDAARIGAIQSLDDNFEHRERMEKLRSNIFVRVLKKSRIARAVGRRVFKNR